MILSRPGWCDVRLWDFSTYPSTRRAVTERTVRRLLQAKKVVILSQEEGEVMVGLPRDGVGHSGSA